PVPVSVPAVPDVLLAETTAGLTVIRGLALGPDQQGSDFPGAVSPHGRAAVATPLGDRLYTAQPLAGNRTRLTTSDAVSGRRTAQVDLAGAGVPRVASPDGTLVALTADGSGGRAHTTIVIADRAGERYRLELAGNYEPDAFAREDTGLCVLQFLP